ncbi:protein SCO1/2 [Halovenus aranensis]|uniref:Protein SCO1/2 n=1 Tax=Halovenus aranensis TaxID=890420 RepID=A0A1G8VR67_9EURY|nr:SCO family protein [Halovenus aranensis]SDJ68578.1 protein SCO1/2 [Halovenus aranensis]
MPIKRVDRRTLLAAGTTAVATAAAGCVDTFVGGESGNDDVVLDPPENYDRRKDLDIPYPTYGEQIPDVSVPAPLHDRTVSTREFVGERHVMMTFIYTSCRTVCPGLTASLRQVQADSVEQEYADEIAFLPTTFDPKQDTPERLRTYGEEMGVNDDADNWYFLRPETPEAAKRVVEDTFGVAFESGEGGHGGDTEATMFQHASVVLLVNKDGFVERAYNGGPPGASEARTDARAVIEGW